MNEDRFETLLEETEQFDSPLERDQALALVAEVRRLRAQVAALKAPIIRLSWLGRHP